MNRKDLVEILHHEKINPSHFALDGGHPSERHVLDYRPGAGWVVYYSERGGESDLRAFDSESEACRHLLQTLREDPLADFRCVVGPLPPAEADQAFAAWRESAGIVTLDPEDVHVDNPPLASGIARRYWVRGHDL